MSCDLRYCHVISGVRFQPPSSSIRGVKPVHLRWSWVRKHIQLLFNICNFATQFSKHTPACACVRVCVFTLVENASSGVRMQNRMFLAGLQQKQKYLVKVLLRDTHQRIPVSKSACGRPGLTLQLPSYCCTTNVRGGKRN